MEPLVRHIVGLLPQFTILCVRNSHDARITDMITTSNTSALRMLTLLATMFLRLRRARLPIRIPDTTKPLQSTTATQSLPILLKNIIAHLYVQSIIVNLRILHIHTLPRRHPPTMSIGVMNHHPATRSNLAPRLYLNLLATGTALRSGAIVRARTDTNANNTSTVATPLPLAPHRSHPNPTVDTLNQPVHVLPTGRLPHVLRHRSLCVLVHRSRLPICAPCGQ